MKIVENLVEWLVEEYPPFFPVDEEKLKNDIQNNIIDGWIPYILWYNKTHNKQLSLPTTPKEFIERVFHCSIEKCSITPPKIGQEISDYLSESKKGGVN